MKKYPSVLISYDAWRLITSEVSHWAKLGKLRGGGPLECVFYPLAAIQTRAQIKRTPFSKFDLADVERFVVAEVFLPPREFTEYSSYSALFRARHTSTEEMCAIFNKGVSEINARYPQLLFLGPGHSHPFSVGTTAPSQTDIDHHIRPYRHKNEELLGLRFSLALIAVQSGKGKGWSACAFAMDENEQVVNLGVAKIADYYDTAVVSALSRPYYRTRRGRRWEVRQMLSLKDRLLEHERWPGGWTTFLIKQDNDTARLVMLPPRFPAQPPLEQIVSLSDRRFSDLELRRFGRAYSNYMLGGENVELPGR